MTTGSDEDLTSYNALCRVGEDGKTRAVLARFPYTVYLERRGEGTLSITTGYEPSLYAAPLPEHSLIYGYSGKYELVILGPDAEKRLIIRKDDPRPEFTSEEKKEFSRIPLPKLKPYFFDLLTDAEGRIYVQRNMNLTIKRGFGPVSTGEKQFDVFSREGAFFFRAALPGNTRVIMDGCVYSYSVDEDQGIEYAQRFRIRNYADLPNK